MLDVGGESTRPGSSRRRWQRRSRVWSRSSTALARTRRCRSRSTPRARRSCARRSRPGAVMINDVRALRLPGALECAAALQVPVCLMHMQGEPRHHAGRTQLHDVVARGTPVPASAESQGASRRCRARAHRARPGLRVRQDARAQSRATGRAAVHCRPRLSGDGWTVTQGNARRDHRSGGHRPTGRLRSRRSDRGPAGCARSCASTMSPPPSTPSQSPLPSPTPSGTSRGTSIELRCGCSDRRSRHSSDRY